MCGQSQAQNGFAHWAVKMIEGQSAHGGSGFDPMAVRRRANKTLHLSQNGRRRSLVMLGDFQQFLADYVL